MVIAANQDTLFARLCTIMGRPELAQDERFADHVARGRHQDELDEMIAAWVVTQDPDTLVDRLTDAGVVAGPINTVAEVVRDPQLLARDMLVGHFDERIGADVLGLGVVPKLSDTPGTVRRAGPPRPGADNDAVWGDLLGISDEDRKALDDKGVI